MLVGSFVFSAGKAAISVASDAAYLNCQLAFKGRNIVSGARTIGTESKMVADLMNAIGTGKLTMTYMNGKGNTNTCNSRPLVDVVEIHNGFTGFVKIRPVNIDTTGNVDYVATFVIKLSNNGTIRLNTTQTVKLEFEGFGTYTTLVDGTTGCDATLTIETGLLPNYATNMLKLEAQNVPTSQVQAFDCYNHTILAIPVQTDKLNLLSAMNVQFDLKNDGIEAYVDGVGKINFIAGGCAVPYSGWVCLPLNAYKSGSISLLSGNTCYLLSNVAI